MKRIKQLALQAAHKGTVRAKHLALVAVTSAPALAMADTIDSEITAMGLKLAGYAGTMVLAGLTFYVVKAAGRKLGFWA